MVEDDVTQGAARCSDAGDEVNEVELGQWVSGSHLRFACSVPTVVVVGVSTLVVFIENTRSSSCSHERMYASYLLDRSCAARYNKNPFGVGTFFLLASSTREFIVFPRVVMRKIEDRLLEIGEIESILIYFSRCSP